MEQNILTRSALTGPTVRKVFRGCVLAAIGAGYFAITASALADHSATGTSSPITVPYRPAAVAPPGAGQSRGPLDTKLDYLAAHTRTVDRLYEELMRWTAPCLSASAQSSIAGRC